MPSYFNSIKVRLNPKSSHGRTEKRTLFQFHKGTIKPRWTDGTDALTPNFNSIKVRLNQVIVNMLYYWYHNFNSIKVRLNLKQAGINAAFVNGFQFHKGTIKPHCFRECNILIYKHIYKCKGTIFY